MINNLLDITFEYKKQINTLDIITLIGFFANIYLFIRNLKTKKRIKLFLALLDIKSVLKKSINDLPIAYQNNNNNCQCNEAESMLASLLTTLKISKKYFPREKSKDIKKLMFKIEKRSAYLIFFTKPVEITNFNSHYFDSHTSCRNLLIVIDGMIKDHQIDGAIR